MIITLLALLLPIAANAYYAEIDGIYYNFSGDEATVTYRDNNYNSYSGAIVIPESVTYNSKTYSVTSIGERAFSGCSGLTTITIPESVTNIDNSAFYRCSGLTTITIPESVTNIDNSAFSGCSKLTSVTLESDAIVSALRDAQTSMKSLFGNQVTKYVIGNAVTSIGNRAFYECSGMTEITIPNSVTSIGGSAFYGCSCLTTIRIPNSVTCIDQYAFEGCRGLTAITIPNSVTSIGHYAFKNCSGLTAITIPNSVTSFGQYPFQNCSGLTSVIIDCPNVGSWFSGLASIKEITLGENVISIGSDAFSGCSGLTSVTIGNGVTSIGNSAFKNCNGLTSVQISDLSTWVNINFNNSGSNPLNYAHHLYLNGSEIKDLVIPTEISSIGQFAFSGCSGLTSVTIPSSVTNIGEYTFQNCPKLKHIYVTSQIPADCSGVHTFYCSTDYARNNYDVYDYAILHVPMGTKEEYSIAYEWRYFAKIKEDLDINGQVFYTTLSVNHAGDGYVKHYVKADEPYTLYIGSEEGMRINTVLYNGEDVTDKLVDGYYTTPNITRPSKIVVSFEQDPDGVANIPAENNLHVYGNDGSLFVSGIAEPQQMFVYTLNGMLINSHTLESDTRIKMSEGTYIVKVGERTFKVLL